MSTTGVFKNKSIAQRSCILCFIILATLTSCIYQPSSAIQPEDGFLIDQYMITFFVAIPPNTSRNAEIYLDVVDEMTGLNLNQVRYQMQAVSKNVYSVEVAFPENSLVKYRYAMGSFPTTVEHDAQGRSIQYRALVIRKNGFMIARDTVSSWTETALNLSLGRLEGKLVDAQSGSGISDLIVNVGGVITVTSATGAFLLENLLPGKYLLTIYSMDGRYGPFQQEAIIAPRSSTPVEIFLSAYPTVPVTFLVTPPSDHNPVAPIRLVGSTAELGNMFAELPSGLSVIAVNAPVLMPRGDGNYSITLDLPVGMDLRYKYTMGDGFWNAERQADGRYLTRQMAVPDDPVTVKDTISSWNAGGRTPIRINALIQTKSTPVSQIYLQLNPYTWMEPLPMWASDDGLGWTYELYSPLHLFSSVSYRLCRDAQCLQPIVLNASDGVETMQFAPDGSQTFMNHTISAMINHPGYTEMSKISVQSRNEAFVAGVELLPYYQPSLQSVFEERINEISGTTSAHWVVLSPAWVSFEPKTPFFQPVPGYSISTRELSSEIARAQAASLHVAMFPSIEMRPNPTSWWQSAGNPDFDWWVTWFNRYSAFINHHAQIAENQGVEALYLGGPQISPAFLKGNISSLPDSILDYWQNLVTDIRKTYSGELVWVVDSAEVNALDPSWLDHFDAIYVLMDLQSSQQQTEKFLDTVLFPLADKTGQRIILGVRYPAIQNAEKGCIQLSETCLVFDGAGSPSYTIPELAIDEHAQAKMYDEICAMVDNRAWISGLISRGYYLPYGIQDSSTSIHGKLAEDVISHWFSHWLPTFP